MELATARIGVSELQASRGRADGIQLSGNISGMCIALEPNCVLLADAGSSQSEGKVVRVSLAEKRVVECLVRVNHTDANLSDVKAMSDGVHVAIALCKEEWKDASREVQYAHTVRLLARKWHTWRVVHELLFDTTSGDSVSFPRLCVSQNLLLCIAPSLSVQLTALEVTGHSKLRQKATAIFDSPPRDLCAFVSGAQQNLVATAHENCTVCVWRHVEAAATSESAFSLEKCFSISSSNTKFVTVIRAAAGLLLQPEGPDKTARFCRTDGTYLEEPLPQPQLGRLSIWCGCPVGRAVLLYDKGSESLITFDI